MSISESIGTGPVGFAVQNPRTNAAMVPTRVQIRTDEQPFARLIQEQTENSPTIVTEDSKNNINVEPETTAPAISNVQVSEENVKFKLAPVTRSQTQASLFVDSNVLGINSNISGANSTTQTVNGANSQPGIVNTAQLPVANAATAILAKAVISNPLQTGVQNQPSNTPVQLPIPVDGIANTEDAQTIKPLSAANPTTAILAKAVISNPLQTGVKNQPSNAPVNTGKKANVTKAIAVSLLSGTNNMQLQANLAQLGNQENFQSESELASDLDVTQDKFSFEKTEQNIRTNTTTTSTVSQNSNLATASRIGAEAVTKFAARLAARANNGTSKFEMRMDPPQLGKIEVKMELNSDNRVQAIMTVENSDVLQDLQRNADSLRRALVSEGFELEANDLFFQLEQQDQGSNAQNFNQDFETSTKILDQLMEDVLIETTHEIDSGQGYWLVPDQRLDIRA